MNKRNYNFYAFKPSEKYHKCDVVFLISVILLWGFGLFTVFFCSQDYAAKFFGNDSYYLVRRQIECSLAGLVLFFIFAFIDLNLLKKSIFYIVLITLILCVLTFIPGISIEKNGARRWIRLPFKFSFQPSELVKLTVVLYLAHYFDKQNEKEVKDRDVLPCVCVFLLFVGLVLLEKDFSTSFFITVIGILIFIVSGSKIIWIIPFLILVSPVIFIAISSEQYRLDRLIGFIHPEQGAESFNFQVNAAKSAISAGGFWGCGIGRGLSKLNSIPEVQADYIFAGWTEAMGFFGVIGYLLMLCLFAWRGYRTALKCPSRFASYGSFGCVSIIFIQSIINCMVVCGLLPSTGIPLPFFSVGGSSIIVTLAMCGFILNASRCEEAEEPSYAYDEVNVDTLTVL